MIKIYNSIKLLEKYAQNLKKGLPEDIFYFVGRLTPYVNVDLIIRCPINGVLLTWRNDKFSGKGWHIPGGIIRFKEKIKERIKKVGKNELGIKIYKFKGPIEINEIIVNQKERSHFISLLFECYVQKKEKKKLDEIIKNNKNMKFFKKKPKNFLKIQEIYKDYF